MKRLRWVFLSLNIITAGVLAWGSGGCGSSTTGSGVTGTSTDLSDSQEQAAMDMMAGEQERSKAMQQALSGALVLDTSSNQTISFGCPIAGSISFAVASPTMTLTFEDCEVQLDADEDLGTGRVNYIFDGTASYTRVNTTTTQISENLIFTRDPQDTSDATTTCNTEGTITNVTASTTSTTTVTNSTYDLDGTCSGGHTLSTTGELTFTTTGSGTSSTTQMDGTLTSAFSGTSSGVVCSYTAFNVTTATCADYAAACGLDADVVCN